MMAVRVSVEARRTRCFTIGTTRGALGWFRPYAGAVEQIEGQNAGQSNVFGEPLEVCSLEPLTGFYRDGFTNTGADDIGSHTVCAVVTAEFLEHQKSIGNDLSTPHPQFGFPGLKPGDRWGVCAGRWLQAYHDGVAAPVVLKATNEAALSAVPLEALTEHAADVPDDPSAFSDGD